jgi:GTPase Era involved in 16S rRNA processing
LELQLLGDVGLIGTPSVGKSSLINCAASTKAKVADYPFTTLVPNLGSVSVGEYRYNMVDIPGLIKGAAEGKGLGNAFLRHVLKARVFAMVMDMTRYNEGIQETISLFDEIMWYIEEKFLQGVEKYRFAFEQEGEMIAFQVYKDEELFMSKRIVFVLNKYDLINDAELVNEYQQELISRFTLYLREKGFHQLSDSLITTNIFITSAGTYYGIGEWIRALAEILKKTPVLALPEIEPAHAVVAEETGEMITEITDTAKSFLIAHQYIDEVSAKYVKVFWIQHPEICRLVFIVPRGNEEAELRFWKQIAQKGYRDILEENGVRKGDILKIKSYYQGYDDRYIMY